MRLSTHFVLAGLAIVGLGVCALSSAEEYDRLAPYPAIRWREMTPEVLVGGRWYILRAIDELDVARIVEHCRATYGRRWQKRFDEDLVEVLSRMGHPPGGAVDLTLEHPETGERKVVRDVPMTHENRRAIWDARNRRPSAVRPTATAAPRKRVRREHAFQPDPEFRQLLEDSRRAFGDAGGATISRAEAEADLDELEWQIEHRYSYRDRLGVDYRAALDAVRCDLSDRVPVDLFGLQLQCVLALFGDGHSRLQSPFPSELTQDFAPYLLAGADGGVVAFLPDRSALVARAYPFVEAIDDVPIADWLEASRRLVTRGSPQLARREALRLLRRPNVVRRVMGRKETEHVRLRLRSPAGARLDIALALSARYPLYGEWPRTTSRLLEGNVGYLRLASMDADERALEALHASMRRFAGTRGLVIDVRGNGGGSRALLRALFPYFLRAGEARVVNVAAYRLAEGDDPDAAEGYLENRFLYPATSAVWSPTARRAIGRVAGRFEPEWQLPADEFSSWHYMVIERPAEDSPPTYERPVVVLLDGGCFSATDIFLGAFKGWRNVTLLGTPSAGGSGRAQWFDLEYSRIRLRLSSMASFRPDGRLYDGNGIEPDVIVAPAPAFFTGEADVQLAAALELLR